MKEDRHSKKFSHKEIAKRKGPKIPKRTPYKKSKRPTFGRNINPRDFYE